VVRAGPVVHDRPHWVAYYLAALRQIEEQFSCRGIAAAIREQANRQPARQNPGRFDSLMLIERQEMAHFAPAVPCLV
jgi:hypothetical protein